MQKIKKIFILVSVLFFMSFMISNLKPAYAAKKTIVPQIIFNTAPVIEYTVGARINFNISAPNYGGRVEYRVILWQDSNKTAHDLWNSSNGFPSRYYTKWQPYGNNTFTLGWPINEPGNYRITVYVKRAGISNSRTALKGMNCDSYKESVSFVVKPAKTDTESEQGNNEKPADGSSGSTTPATSGGNNTTPGAGGGVITTPGSGTAADKLTVEAAGVVLSDGTIINGTLTGINEYCVDISGYARTIGVKTSITVNKSCQLDIMGTKFMFTAHVPKTLGPSDFGMVDNDPPGISIGNLRDNYANSLGYYSDSITLTDESNNKVTITIKMKVK